MNLNISLFSYASMRDRIEPVLVSIAFHCDTIEEAARMLREDFPRWNVDVKDGCIFITTRKTKRLRIKISEVKADKTKAS